MDQVTRYSNDIEIAVNQTMQSLFKVARIRGVPLKSPPFNIDPQLREQFKSVSRQLLVKYLIPEAESEKQ